MELCGFVKGPFTDASKALLAITLGRPVESPEALEELREDTFFKDCLLRLSVRPKFPESNSAYRKKPLYVDLPRDPAVFVDSSHDPVSVKFPHQSVPDSLVNSSQDLVSVRDDAKAKGVQGSDPSATNDQDSVSSDESQGCATGDTLEGQVDIVIPDSI